MISTFNQSALDEVRQLPLRSELAEPPNEDEILEALGQLAVGKAGGMNGLLPDVLKCCGGPLLEYIVVLFRTVWEERRVPLEWRDALLVPVPKKGDLSCCDNWRGISLLDVMGKLFARVLNNRLQLVVEETVSDSQCGFRAGRGCVDMIFCVRQLVEKAIEHNTKVFLLFVDLRKAYDSVPRAALWCTLQRRGIPDVMIEFVRSLHDGMSATVTAGGGRLELFLVRNGLRQGCTIAPTLFILYFSFVIDRWLSRCQAAGVEVQFKLGGKLVSERTRRPSSFVMSECLFADDAALVCSCRENMALAARMFDEVAGESGFTLSVPKTKLLLAGTGLTSDDLAPLDLDEGVVDVVDQFKYLGSLVEARGGMVAEVSNRIAQASRAFGSLRNSVFTASDLTLETKRMVYRSVVLGALLYGTEAWAPTQELVRKLDCFHRRCVRCILGVSRTVQWRDRLTTAELAGRFGMVESIGDLLTQWRLRWLGHVARMSDVRHPKRLLFGWFPQKRPAHSAKLRWRDKVRQDLKKCGITESSWYVEAQDRAKWKSFCQSRLFQHVMAPPLHKQFICNTCHRSFRRRQDLSRHRCTTTRPRQ